MRRKLLVIFIFAILVVFILDNFGVDLYKGTLLPVTSHKVNLIGKVERINRKNDGRCAFVLNVFLYEGKQVNKHTKVLVNTDIKQLDARNYLYENVSINCTIAQGKGERNPRCFDYNKHLLSQGIGNTAKAKNISITARNNNIFESIVKKMYFKRLDFENLFSEEYKGFVSGIIFGDTSQISEEAYEDFRRNGTGHILAVSGLHIGILYSLYLKLIGKRISNTKILIFIVFLLFYCSMSGWQASIIRASFMVVMSLIAKKYDLHYDLVTSMSFIGLILILDKPYIIFNTGFQMSYLAVYSLSSLIKKVPNFVPTIIATPLVISIGLSVYQIYKFNYISLISFIINIPIVFLAGILVPILMLSFVFYCAFGASNIAVYLSERLTRLLVLINELASSHGKTSMDISWKNAGILLFIGLTILFFSSELFLILRERKNITGIAKALLAILICSIGFQVVTFSPITYDDIIFVDVGQGDCIHIRENRINVLIDGGGTNNYNIGQNTLKPYLLKNGVSKIDMAIASHLHMDHYKGIVELNECFKVGSIEICSTAGKKYRISKNTYIETLWPVSIDPIEGQEKNSSCSVFMIYMGKYKVLVTGDLDIEGEEGLIALYKNTDKLEADVLKIGHHGSKTSTSESFLDIVKPKIAIIQVGQNNYGHPSGEVLDRIKDRGIAVFRTDYHGAVGIRFTDKGIKIHRVIA